MSITNIACFKAEGEVTIQFTNDVTLHSSTPPPSAPPGGSAPPPAGGPPQPPAGGPPSPRLVDLLPLWVMLLLLLLLLVGMPLLAKTMVLAQANSLSAMSLWTLLTT